MLLLTDAPAESMHLKQTFGLMQPCTMLPINEACKRPAVHELIACHVALDDPGSQELLGAALTHHRTTEHTPVLFLVRDAASAAQAQALGATETLAHNASREQLLFWLKRCRMAKRERIYRPTPAPTRASETQAAVEIVGAGLLDLLNAARRNEPVSLATLEKGAEHLLMSLRRGSLRDWLDVVKRYDDATYQHCLLVAGLVAAFSLRLGLSPASQHLIAQGALVHDIGKASVPQAVLNKAGPLTPAEQDLMRKHPVSGYVMLAAQRGIHPTILDIVHHHHEMIDGSGYPDGLRGRAISDTVRIVTICDIYAALIERRPYKAPMSPDEGREVLVAMGAKLDAGLLRSFDAVISDS